MSCLLRDKRTLPLSPFPEFDVNIRSVTRKSKVPEAISCLVGVRHGLL